jgi:Na+/proline symporter
MNFLSNIEGYGLLFSFWIFMIVVTLWNHRRGEQSKENFLLANRDVGVLRGALSIAASWVWAPALFIASQKAYDQGLAGVFWFTVPNILTLMLFAFLAVRIRELVPEGFTLPQFIKQRYDNKTHIVYVFMFISLQVCSLAVQLLAGASVINHLTGIPILSATVSLAFVFLSYSLISGLRASVVTDIFQMLLILVTCFVVVPFILFFADGFFYLREGIGGSSGNFSNIFDVDVAYSFGILVTIGLLAGPIGDQMHWQRAFALRKERIKQSYILSGFFFSFVPILLSLLGFIAAGMSRTGGLEVANRQLSGLFVVQELAPFVLLILFVFMLLAGLASTGDSVLCAVSSLVSIDIYKSYVSKNASDGEILKVSRFSMILVTIFAVGIALIPGMSILYLFLFYGTLRACDMLPTIISLFVKEIDRDSIFWAVLIATIFALPLFVVGELLEVLDLKIVAIVGGVLLSAGIPLVKTRYSKNKVDFFGKKIQ